MRDRSWLRPGDKDGPGAGTPPLIGTGELLDRLNDPRVRILDASWHLPDTGRSALAEYEAGHIPGALFLDMANLADPAHPLPDTVPLPSLFAERAGALGIDDRTLVVVYDSVGIYSAARAWWMFKLFGHEAVTVLDGGLAAWTLGGHRLEQGPPPPPSPASFTARTNPALLADWRTVLRASEQGSPKLVDARMPERFLAAIPDPYPGEIRGGHIPGSANVYWRALLDPESGCLRPEEELAAAFAAAGLGADDTVITTCGSGVAAAVVGLALEHLGRRSWALYDGSWNEWGRRHDLPVATTEP